MDDRRPDWGAFSPREVQEIVDADEPMEMDLFIVRTPLYQADLDRPVGVVSRAAGSWDHRFGHGSTQVRPVAQNAESDLDKGIGLDGRTWHNGEDRSGSFKPVSSSVSAWCPSVTWLSRAASRWGEFQICMRFQL